MNQTNEQIKWDALVKKNKLMNVIIMVLALISTAVTYLIGQKTFVILSILIGGAVLVILLSLLLKFRKGMYIFPYISVFGLAAIVGNIVIFSSTSPQNIGLIYFVLIVGALYLSRAIFIFSFAVSLILLISFIMNYGEAFQLDYPTSLLIFFITSIILYGQQLIAQQTNDKLEELQLKFNEQFEKEKEQKTAIEEQANIIQKTMDLIKDRSKEHNESIYEMNQSMQEIASGTTYQAEAVTTIQEHIRGTLSEINDMMKELDYIKSLTSITNEKAEKGYEQSKELIDFIQRFQQSLLDVKQSFNHLSETVESSVHSLQAIQEINAQTSLLALNASIEAARAGEHGKGFAVVADEIRKLAENTDQTAIDISNNLKRIKDSNNEAELQMEQITEALHSNIQMIHENGELFEEFQKGTNLFTAKIININEKSQTVEQNTNKIEEAVTQFSSTIQQSSASIEEISATIQAQSKQNEILHGEIEQTTDALHNLTQSNQ